MLSSLFRISSSGLKVIVELSFAKSIEFRKSTDIYFQKTLSLPLSVGLSITNRIPGSSDTSLQIKAGKARSFNEYLIS